jgi:hypothetical protein
LTWAPLDQGLFALRGLSVALSVASLALTARLARQFGTPPGLAVALTLGCYGFVQTGIVARGFALAQVFSLAAALLSLGGGRARAVVAGICFGAAAASNYLAIFAAGGFLAALWLTRRIRLLPLALGALPGLALAAWCFAAQRGSRPDQFPSFEPLPALLRLARYGVAAVFGGLPLYVPAPGDIAVAAAVGALGIGILFLIARWGAPMARWPPLAAALAQPAGLLGLGILFNNTPIELRYLSFALPFAMIALAGALAARPVLGAVTLGVQALSILGLALAPATMQPTRHAAIEAGILAAPGSVTLLPWGDDGVGIPGGFAIHALPDTRLLLIRRTDTADTANARLADARHVVVVTLSQDGGARAVAPLIESLTQGWEPIATGRWASAYRRIIPPARSETDPYHPDPPRTSSAPRGPGPGDASGG